MCYVVRIQQYPVNTTYNSCTTPRELTIHIAIFHLKICPILKFLFGHVAAIKEHSYIILLNVNNHFFLFFRKRCLPPRSILAWVEVVVVVMGRPLVAILREKENCQIPRAKVAWRTSGSRHLRASKEEKRRQWNQGMLIFVVLQGTLNQGMLIYEYNKAGHHSGVQLFSH